MERFDEATFAQLPPRLTPVPGKPVEVDPWLLDAYEISSYPASWRMGKKMLGYYPPFRFDLGDPSHAGGPWEVMVVGPEAMSGLMAK